MSAILDRPKTDVVMINGIYVKVENGTLMSCTHKKRTVIKDSKGTEDVIDFMPVTCPSTTVLNKVNEVFGTNFKVADFRGY